MRTVTNRLGLLIILLALIAGSASASEQTPEYRLGPEDAIIVNVARHPEFSGEFLIPADGVVDFPAVGQTRIVGKTLEEVSIYVKKSLSERLVAPEVNVTLKMPRMQRVYVLGAVDKPGLYDLKPGWRVAEAVAAAGGVVKGTEASDCKAKVLRAGTGAQQSVELRDALNGSAQANLSVASGDVVTIEAEETMPVYVVGQVKLPGLYRLRKDGCGVMEALTLAGGSLEDAALTHVTITHVSGGTETVNLASVVVDGKEGINPKLRPGDLVVVPESTARVAVLGYVTEPGFFPLKDGKKILLSDALGLAKGVDNKRGGIKSVAIIRTENGVQKKSIYDLGRFLKSGDASQNPEIRSGDVVYVPETGKTDWEMVLRAVSSVGILMNPVLNYVK